MIVIAVVVTYNRISLLKKTIHALLNQTIKLNNIIVVNNNSTDGTKEWLDSQDYIQIIHQGNVGGAGGFKRGMEEAIKSDVDWIWTMDDDVAPSFNCLEKMLHYEYLPNCGILTPCRYFENNVFLAEYKKINLTNPFKDLGIHPVQENDTKNPVIEIQTIAFEGPLIKKDVVDKIGLPDSDYFILYDDTDYAYRTISSGFNIYMIPSAKMERIEMTNPTNKFGWKSLYDIHNNVIFHKKYGKNIFVKYFRPISKLWMYCLSYINNVWRNNKRFQSKDIIYMHKAFLDGYRKKYVNYIEYYVKTKK